MIVPPYYVITGASGAGKSTLVAALSDLGYSTVQEAALAVLREQIQSNGGILPSTDRLAFTEAVLARNIQAYLAAQRWEPPVFFDRGIPECLAWLQLAASSARPPLAAGTPAWVGICAGTCAGTCARS